MHLLELGAGVQGGVTAPLDEEVSDLEREIEGQSLRALVYGHGG